MCLPPGEVVYWKNRASSRELIAVRSGELASEFPRWALIHVIDQELYIRSKRR